jgi:hypothetical protein
MLKKSKSINAKFAKELREGRREIIPNDLALSALRLLCVLCGLEMLL